MGTRADFYVGRGRDAEWLGSIAWDGYPDGLAEYDVLDQSDEAVYRRVVAAMFAKRDDATLPDQGWPWPWEDSRTTDYAYAFDGGQVWGSCFGHEWFAATEPEPDDEDTPKTAEFPDMTQRQNVTLGKRSGVTFISVPVEEE